MEEEFSYWEKLRRLDTGEEIEIWHNGYMFYWHADDGHTRVVTFARKEKARYVVETVSTTDGSNEDVPFKISEWNKAIKWLKEA